MATDRHGEVSFYTAPMRSVLPLEDGGLCVSRSLRAQVRRREFVVTTDTAFERVVTACADVPRDNGGTWINDWIIQTYTKLHRAGMAHSVEVWAMGGEVGLETRPPVDIRPAFDSRPPDETGPRLVGGLYGVHLGGAFFGESMFSLPELGGTGASKVALVQLWHHLRARGFKLLDTQVANEHMAQFGIVEVPHKQFLKLLQTATKAVAEWGPPGPMAQVPDIILRGKGPQAQSEEGEV
jgi:leucyl/phenylalanyl-tRNA---protein transferase